MTVTRTACLGRPRPAGGAIQRAAGIMCLPLGAYAAATTAYLTGLTFAALVPAPHAPQGGTSNPPCFDLIIPAHDEETTLPHLLKSVAALDYPRDRLRVHVVADNCADQTAAIARDAGAAVYERRATDRLGKGYALEHGIAAVLALAGNDRDGVLVVDADSELAPNVLHVLAGYLEGGASAVQAYYSVHNAEDSSVAMLRYTALCLYNYLRLRGRSRLGLSAGLRGNGMCFSRGVLREIGWTSFGLAEDVEQHFRLLKRGIRVRFAPDAIVTAEMPVSFRDAVAQNSRWERGRLASLRSDVPKFLLLAARRQDLAALDAAAEQMVAPLSVCVGAAAATVALGIAARSRIWTITGLACVLGQALYVLVGLRLAGAPLSAYRALAGAPGYVLWKVWVWVRAVARPPTGWTRTARVAEQRVSDVTR